ncbi:hypothetical protein Zm00014a_032295 [Zea mays]|uniref:Uncharacterized protein n=1 Tax=Zea mays TaxID=4577 RepID=A0A3L6DCG9_MAIZE|nr:hypothetical protein Zm00014a_032295 [Zea mays]
MMWFSINRLLNLVCR